MAADFFLDIDGIKGESTDATFKDKIQVLSWSWGEANTGSMSSGTGGGSGKVVMQDFNFVMKTNKASPELLLSCALGTHIKKAQLICRKAGGKQKEYMKISFTDLLISSFKTGASSNFQAGAPQGGDDLPTDQIAFNYSSIKYEYSPQKADGELDTPIIRGYDLKTQKKI